MPEFNLKYAKILTLLGTATVIDDPVKTLLGTFFVKLVKASECRIVPEPIDQAVSTAAYSKTSSKLATLKRPKAEFKETFLIFQFIPLLLVKKCGFVKADLVVKATLAPLEIPAFT